MPRILFQKAASGFRTVRGRIVKDLQERLQFEGFSPGDLDGDFGGNTLGALIGWQKRAGLSATGKVCEETWTRLMQQPIPPLKVRCLQLTAAYEGTGFEGVVGNFDGAGITWGIIGFTLKHGELARILGELRESHPAIVSAAFGPVEGELFDVLSRSLDRQLAWASSISLGSQRVRVLPQWREAFARLGATPEGRAAQLARVETYFEIARGDARDFGLVTELGQALCFDIAVQNGGVDPEETKRVRRRLAEEPPTKESDVRAAIANVVAEASHPEYVEDVRKRKLTFAAGEGSVHGARYRLRDWGLDELPGGL